MVRQSSFWLTALVGSAQSFPLTVTKGQNHNFGTLIQHQPSTHHTTRIGNNNHFNSHNTPLPATRLFSTFALDDDDDDVLGQEDRHDGVPTFSALPNLHPSLKSALHKASLVKMTEVQHKTWEAASGGTDVLARARTGTGKTVAFLLPAIQQIVSQQQQQQGQSKSKGIQILILSPTRELASQIHDQAKLLTINVKDTISSQVIFGGTSRNNDVKMFERLPPTILVATPGRLKDHLESTKLRGGNFSDLLKSTSVLVLDETDRMLDMGFKKEVDEIIRYLPKNRQTLLFSATVPDELRKVMAATMKKDFITVDCIQNNSEHTNSQVEQSHVIIKDDSKRMVTGTVEILMNIIQTRDTAPTKMVVFFPTSNMVAFYAALFRNGLGIPVFELHSRKSQAFRTKTADKFRKHNSGILFTSDVSARGVDYPGVTNVVQVGIADSKESYIHRLGRTGRAGKVGSGLLVLTKSEQRFLRDLKGIKVPVDRLVQEQMDRPPSDALMAKLGPILESIGNGSNAELSDAASSAYRSILGFYNSKTSKLGFTGADQMITFCNGFALQSGFSKAPPIEANVVRKMGLAKARGLNVVAALPPPVTNLAGRQGGDYRSGGGGGGGGRFSSGGRGGGSERSGSGGERSRSRGPSNDRFDSLVEGSGSRGPYSASRRSNDNRGRDY